MLPESRQKSRISYSPSNEPLGIIVRRRASSAVPAGKSAATGPWSYGAPADVLPSRYVPPVALTLTRDSWSCWAWSAGHAASVPTLGKVGLSAILPDVVANVRSPSSPSARAWGARPRTAVAAASSSEQQISRAVVILRGAVSRMVGCPPMGHGSWVGRGTEVGRGTGVGAVRAEGRRGGRWAVAGPSPGTAYAVGPGTPKGARPSRGQWRVISSRPSGRCCRSWRWCRSRSR